jgi:putative ABC transport system ATP-binding protein
MSAVISLEGVTKIYQMGETEVRALREVTFSIEQGEFISIMGPSGSGKSTCMNMIGCLDSPTSGAVRVDNNDTRALSEKQLARLRNQTVGFVFQQYHLLASMTVLENVMLPLRYMGVDFARRKEAAMESLEKVAMGNRLHHRPHELSGGQKQRAAIARAIVTKPKIILADEPTGALDSETGGTVLNIFSQIHKEGTTVIIVTHDSSVSAKAARCIKMFDGKVASDEVRSAEAVHV